MERKIAVTNDMAFQQIFGKVGNERITKALLEKVLDIEIDDLTLDINRQLLGDFWGDKVGIVDIKAKLSDGTKVIIEMQVAKYKYITQRLLYYWAKNYVEDLRKGDHYRKLDKVIAILITAKNLEELEGIDNYHTKWQIREEEEQKRKLLDDLEIHIIELGKFNEENKRPEGDWIKFIKEGSDMGWKEDFDKEIQEAMEELDRIALDPERRAEYEAKEQYLRDKIAFTMGEIEDAREEGMKQGIAEGIKKGIEDGMQQGMQQGIKQGVEQGIEKGKIEGKKEGRKEGIEIAQKETILKLFSKNYTSKQIANILDISEERIKKVTGKLKN